MRLALMAAGEQQQQTDGLASYHLVLGGEENANSWISKQMNGPVALKTISRRHQLQNILFIPVQQG